MRGDEIRLLAFFPQSKPFWDDCAHKLKYSACDFSQKSNDKAINWTNWTTKTIKKGGKTHIVAFCPVGTTGHPWIIHDKAEYLLLRVDVTADKNQTVLTQQQKAQNF
jgi:hypothetical protein